MRLGKAPARKGRGRASARGPRAGHPALAIGLALPLAGLPGWPLAGMAAAAAEPLTVRAILHDGREIGGAWKDFRDGALVIAGLAEPLPIHELSSLVLGPENRDETAKALDAGPAVFFREGETLAARVTRTAGAEAMAQVLGLESAPGREGPSGAGPGAGAGSGTGTGAPSVLRIPLEVLRGFRIREAHKADDLFEADLAEAGGKGDTGAPRRTDAVYVRRPTGLLRVEGVLRSLDDEHLSLDLGGEAKRLRRQLVLGVILAPVASRIVESEVPAVLDVASAGQVPCFLRGLREADGRHEVLFRFAGSAPDAVQALPAERVQRIRFSSDRIVFLSSLEPALVEEVPLLGAVNPFPWRKDMSVTGGPLKLGGRTYRRGIGVHPRSVLEYDLGGRFRSFAAVIGLDDVAGKGSAVTFRVAADGKELYRKDMGQGAIPETVALPLEGVKRLRLEVDYGEDGVDFGDHAAWADARVAR